MTHKSIELILNEHFPQNVTKLDDVTYQIKRKNKHDIIELFGSQVRVTTYETKMFNSLLDYLNYKGE